MNAARSLQQLPMTSTATTENTSPRSEGRLATSRIILSCPPDKKKSEMMAAAVTARIASTPKTPNNTVVARPTSAVKPLNITSKVDSGLARAGPGRTPVVRAQRSHSAGPTSRKSSLPNRQVAALKCSTAAPSPDTARKRNKQQQPMSLADDEASDTEPEGTARGRREEASPLAPRPRPRKVQEVGGGGAARGRRAEVGRRCPEAGNMSKSSSSVHLAPGSRPRSTSLTRSQSARLGGRGGGAPAKQAGVVRPRSSTLATPTHAARGEHSTPGHSKYACYQVVTSEQSSPNLVRKSN